MSTYLLPTNAMCWDSDDSNGAGLIGMNLASDDELSESIVIKELKKITEKEPSLCDDDWRQELCPARYNI